MEDDEGPSTRPRQSPGPSSAAIQSPGAGRAPTQSPDPAVQPTIPTAQSFQMMPGAYPRPFMYPNPYMFPFLSTMAGGSSSQHRPDAPPEEPESPLEQP
ncbi:hypothetical protein Gotur_025692 [Gossypium turneri]